jgi:uncharacterized cupredoxin-like copper-binding protein
MKRFLLLAVPAAAMTFVGLALASTHHRGATTTVRVALAPGGDPTKLRPSVSSVKAGTVTFLVHNYGNIPHKSYGVVDAPTGHELVVLRTNLRPDKLKTNKAGDAVETGRVGKPVALDPGRSGSITLNLPPGKYVLICNLLGHYAAGQYAGLTVVG